MVSEVPVEAAIRLYQELATAAGLGAVVGPDTYRRRGQREGAWRFEAAAEGDWPEACGGFAWQDLDEPER